MFRATTSPSSGETTVYATLGTCYSVWMTDDGPMVALTCRDW